MKRKLGIWLLGIAVTIGVTHSLRDSWGQLSTLPQSVLAQSAPQDFDLEPMSIERLDNILRQQVNGNITAQPGQWQFSINEISVIVLADPNANRMRIFSPVINAEELTSEQMQRMMLANFHTTLDARYAIANSGIVVSTVIHPLSSLQERDLLSALNQVSSLATTFGSSYTSGEQLFIPRGDGNRDNLPPPPGDSFPDDLDDVNARNLILSSQN